MTTGEMIHRGHQ